ncbi:unnamed protein product [Symbiodinium natans]|uniref:Tyr recombinase domain-containing protein n=1 Tax=Symbiodinium natans TaxID=878477 RepID=A0A812R3C8_9DINO|nr:unnamed protein product [Symbiodinium natans]CAE7456597.1 unnamed protein product [Symbiodinium natans]
MAGQKKSRKGIKLGQAPALSVSTWAQWIKFVGQEAGARMAMILSLTYMFGLRCSEALTLKRSDFSFHGDIPKLVVTGETQGNRKSPGEVYCRKKHMCWLKSVFKSGYTVERTKKHKHGKGRKKTITRQDKYEIPSEGFLFRSRKEAKQPHLHYHAVYAQVKRLAPRFLEHLRNQGQKWGPEVAKLRPHSGRATLITELLGDGMSTALSMKFARHASGSVKVHLKYGRLTLKDVKAACDKMDSKGSTWPDFSRVPTAKLKRARLDIDQELRKRVKN